MNPQKRRKIALWRMSILGTLVSARLEHGDTQSLLEAAASRTYETPDGRRVRFEWRTLESWYYAYKRGGLGALEPRPRRDAGTCRAIADETAKYIVGLRREDPRRSVRVLMRAAKRRKLEGADRLAKSSVVRLLRAHGLSSRPRATPERERRAFTVELPGDLWMGDARHCPAVPMDAVRRPRGVTPSHRRGRRGAWTAGGSPRSHRPQAEDRRLEAAQGPAAGRRAAEAVEPVVERGEQVDVDARAIGDAPAPERGGQVAEDTTRRDLRTQHSLPSADSSTQPVV